MTSEFDIEAVLEGYRGRGREALLPVLWDVQGALRQYQPRACA